MNSNHSHGSDFDNTCKDERNPRFVRIPDLVVIADVVVKVFVKQMLDFLLDKTLRRLPF